MFFYMPAQFSPSSGLILLVLFSLRNRNLFVNTNYHLFGNDISEIRQLRYFLRSAVFRAYLTAVKLEIYGSQ